MNEETPNGAVAVAEVPQPVVPPPGEEVPATVPVERISPDEMAYHNQVLGNARGAQAAFSSWAQHLANKYQISQTDRINEDGTISRNVPQPQPMGQVPQG